MNRFPAGMPVLALLVLATRVYGQQADPAMRLVDVRKIWDRAPHNAFTDLARFRDRWFCVFREGKAHVSPDGAVRILTSADGAEWEPAALLTSSAADLRDPKLAVTPDGRLMLCAAGALHDRSKQTHQSWVWFSNDGRTWSSPCAVGDPDFWLWRVTWHGDRAYSVGYSSGKKRTVRLYCSRDGTVFDTLVGRLFEAGSPNEASVVFDGDTACCLLRRDGTPGSGLLGMSRPPYTEWEWKDLGAKVGGPNLLLLPDGRLVAAVRLYDGKVRTSLCWLDAGQGKLTEALRLPSGGDTSYAGLVFHGGLLWVSYYSSHEGKAAIYLARVEIAGSGWQSRSMPGKENKK